ncbi:futalosine hydrolase [Polluticoccus soli]|uniref:futalosine hydrolase n=1 Tax=Polluticoccus soli TaxID=3034150 RepID=UPI0023E2F6B0|nr:futalosine hydrolase [Flavipsychrobacter sp. JY13-12]
MNILLAAATEAEIAPSIQQIATSWQQVDPRVFQRQGKRLTVCITGVGMMATAYHLAKACSATRFDMALQAGIGGAFHRQINLGDLVFVRSEQLGDLGAEDGEAYLDIFELGLLQHNELPFTGGRLAAPTADFHKLIDLPPVDGLTVNMVSGNEASIIRLAERYQCGVESMEGAAFHYVCLQEGIPFAQVRAISNYIERRNRANWKIGDAITNLNSWLVSFVGRL